MENKTIYNIGQILTAREDIELEGCLGTRKTVKKGTKIYIGADNLAHHKDGTIQPLEDNVEVKGYSVGGLADFIWLYIRNDTPINEDTLGYYGETPDCIFNAIRGTLEDFGFYNHVGE